VCPMTRHSKINYFDPSNDVIHFHILTCWSIRFSSSAVPWNVLNAWRFGRVPVLVDPVLAFGGVPILVLGVLGGSILRVALFLR
jgi:hypothetical protein